jgi:signal transduction histidine kinase
MVIQGTTLALGRLLITESAFIQGTGVQDAITPKMQTIRNTVVMILFVLLFILITYIYAWYHALWVIIATFFTSTAFPIILGMRAGSSRIVSIILTDMERRRKVYLESGDELRSNAISDLINCIRNMPQERIMKEVKR